MRKENFCTYEGTNESGSILVKKFMPGDSDMLQLVTDEISIESNTNGGISLLNLLGRCLETEIPVLVYEFGLNLSHEIINNMPWETKLRIANQIALAVSYLHCGTSRVIIHEDIQIGHIYLDQKNVAKLLLVQIPSGKTNVDTIDFFGSTGYLAPEVVWMERFRQLTKKRNVYNLGILLMEILIGRKVGKWYTEILDEVGNRPRLGFCDTVRSPLKNSVDS